MDDGAARYFIGGAASNFILITSRHRIVKVKIPAGLISPV